MSADQALAFLSLLTPTERQTIVEWFLATVSGKPPKPVRIAALRKREILALAKVAGKL